MRSERPARGFRPAAPITGTAERGFSLIEAMISLTLGLVVIAAFGQLYAGSRQATILSDTMARLDEHGRFAVDFIANDLRMAGYLSCGGPTASLGNAVKGGQVGGSWLFRAGGIEGYDGDASATKGPPSDFTGQTKPGTDIMIVRRAAIDVERSVIDNDATAARMRLGLKHGFEVGEVLVIADSACTQTSVFQVTGLANQADPDDSDNFDSIRHDPSASVEPGNCTGRLFGSFDCNNSDGAYVGIFGPGSVVSRCCVHAYFVTAGDSPALTRRSLGLIDGQVGVITETLIRDVEDFQVLYGRNTAENVSLSVDDYVTADRVTDWERIVSVRFMLLLRSPEPNIRTQTASLTYEKRVNADAATSEHTKRYPAGNYKPVGLLHTYGEDDQILFGLLTGSYAKNKSGGVLRKNVSSFGSEVNVATTGTFTNVTGIVDTLNRFRIARYEYRDGKGYYITTDSCDFRLASFTDGACSNWGNSLSEIYLESLRYMAGVDATEAFKANDNNYIAGLTSPEWADPIDSDNWCAHCDIILINASDASYDGDTLSTSGLPNAPDPVALTNALGVAEKIAGNSFFVGENGTDNNQLCTARTVNELGKVRGACPGAPRLSGSYLLTGLAHWAHTNDLRLAMTGAQQVTTRAITLLPGVPNLEIPIPGDDSKVSILPACRNLDLKPSSPPAGGCAIVDFKIIEHFREGIDRRAKGDASRPLQSNARRHAPQPHPSPLAHGGNRPEVRTAAGA